jgi:hypothetical protein
MCDAQGVLCIAYVAGGPEGERLLVRLLGIQLQGVQESKAFSTQSIGDGVFCWM